MPKRADKGDSQCLMCGRIFYGERREKCVKCGGRCAFYREGEIAKTARNGPIRGGMTRVNLS